MSDIVKRLAKCAAVSEIIKDNPKLYYDAMYEIERLRAENEKLKAAFRVNMLRHVPNITHEEINAVIADAALKETGNEA